MQVLDYGATLVSVCAADRAGQMGEVALGFDQTGPYTDGRSPYFGCVAGRVANRIAKGAFTLDGKTYSLAVSGGHISLRLTQDRGHFLEYGSGTRVRSTTRRTRFTAERSASP